MNFNELIKYLHLIYKRRYIFLAVSLIITTGIIAVVYSLPKKYKVDSTVFIEKNVINDLVKGLAVAPDMEARIKVLKYALLSRDILSKVLRDLDVDAKIGNQKELNALITDLQKRTSITLKDKEPIFTVSFVDKDPAFAQAFVNKLVSKYVEENISGKRDETYGANRFLDEQLTYFKKKLEDAEDAIIRFRKEQGVVVASDEQGILGELQQYQKEIDGINLSLETQKARIRSLQGQLRTLEPTVAVFSEKQREDRLVQVEQKIKHLLLSYTDNYPEVVRLKLEAEALRKDLKENKGASVPVSSELTTVNPLYQDVRQKVMEAQTEISALEGKRGLLRQLAAAKEHELQGAPENRKTLNALVQERDSVKKIYDELLLRTGQAEVSKQMEIGDKTTTFRIVDPAVYPRSPIFPDKPKMILMAIAAGLGCGFGLVFLLDATKGSVREPSALEGLGLNVLACIPHMTDEAQAARIRKRDLVVYSVSGGYFCCFIGLLAFEVLKKML